MTKDVLITIRGVHTMDEEDNDVEMIVRGDYYQKNGKHYVLYEELLEGFKEPVKIMPLGFLALILAKSVRYE